MSKILRSTQILQPPVQQLIYNKKTPRYISKIEQVLFIKRFKMVTVVLYSFCSHFVVKRRRTIHIYKHNFEQNTIKKKNEKLAMLSII